MLFVEEATFCKFFSISRRTTIDASIASIDDTIWRSVHRYQAQGPQYNATELDPVVRILEQSSPELYKRLFGVSLADTCEVLIHSETCLAQRRGFYLLSVSAQASLTQFSLMLITNALQDALHTNVAQLESRTVVRDKMEKKIVIGSKVLITLIEGFGASENDDQTRRWVSPPITLMRSS